jgi:hypothetical protein
LEEAIAWPTSRIKKRNRLSLISDNFFRVNPKDWLLTSNGDVVAAQAKAIGEV